MIETLEVRCPDCDSILIVNKKTGKVLEVRRPLVEDPSGDRFEDAITKARHSAEESERKFEAARKREAEKMSKLDKIFKEGLEKAKEEPLEKPIRDIDLD